MQEVAPEKNKLTRMAPFSNLLTVAAIMATRVACTDQNTASGPADWDAVRAENIEPLWRYRCVPDEGCQRVLQDPTFSNELTPFLHDSLDVCRTSCGRFGGLWPRPATAALSSQTLLFHPQFLRFDVNNVPTETRELLVKMTQVTTDAILAECGGQVTTIVDTPMLVDINIKSEDLTFSWDTDESYILDVQGKVELINVHIKAQTVFGARHGLETLSQLVAANYTYTEQGKQCALNILAGAKIKDKPVYPHRGLVLDTSRNFIPVKSIKRTIDGMGASKLNILHWHATDSHSFPLESTRVPLLTKYGAYSSSEIYTVKEIKELLQYARVRGVRVVLEIDSPAHAGNGWQWGKKYGLGDLAVCVNSEPWRPLCIEPPCGQLNPANPHMYNVLRDLYMDIIELWPKGELFHMGGDEVFINCWNQTQEIVNYMEGLGLKRDIDGFRSLWSQFHSRILQIWDEENRAAGVRNHVPVMVWSSDLTQAAHVQKHFDRERYVIEVWEPLNSPLIHELIAQGYSVVAAPKDIWYLDHGFWGRTVYSNWRRMYAHRLPNSPKVVGGEVAMWSEYVDDSDLDGRIWPRAAAVAERLWADPSGTAAEAEPRMQRHRARLVARGLRADVLSPQWCTANDKRCL